MGSHFLPTPSAQLPGAVVSPVHPDPNQKIRVTIVLTSRAPAKQRLAAIDRMSRQLPHEREYVSLKDLEQQYGARPESASRVEAFAGRHGLGVDERSLPRRAVVLSGTLASFAAAFGIRFVAVLPPAGDYQSFRGAIRIPQELEEDIDAVLGLDTRPLFVRHAAATAAAPVPGVDPRIVATRYDFPTAFTGRGQTAAVIVLGGGFDPTDVDTYFRERSASPATQIVLCDGQQNTPAPADLIRQYLKDIGFTQVKVAVPVASTGSKPGHQLTPEQFNAIQWTLESSMDVQLLGVLAPAARLMIYRTSNTEQGKYDALTRAMTYPGGTSVISCSWGNHESTFTPEWMDLLDEVFQTAALAGITLCYSSGDDGDGAAPGGTPRAHFPASSPHVLACGGTLLPVDHPAAPETVWSQTIAGHLLRTGGGVSDHFRTPPAWQAQADVPGATGSRHGRGLPDVAARADLSPGYAVGVAGMEVGLGGGTSAAAPLWAALIARLNEALGARCGYLTPLLYRAACRTALRDVIQGSNGAYHARPGWDACTGWGTPRGTALVSALR